MPALISAESDQASVIEPRGPLSALVSAMLVVDGPRSADAVLPSTKEAVAGSPDVLRDPDIQLALFLLYALHYGSLPHLEPRWEWHPGLIAARGEIERAMESALRSAVAVPEIPAPQADAVARALFAFTAPSSGPSLSRYLAKTATLAQAKEFLISRSIYTLREADPHSWAIPRLTGRAKAALVEIQSDEYGGGDPERVHATIFARAMRGAGLDDRYGAYVNSVSALTLASQNVMSMFGLNARLLGAVVGHLAAFEMTSSIPNRSYADGFRRLGFGPDVTGYFDEHVEADAVHEQIAARDLAGSLAEDRPELLEDIMFGAAACLAVDGWAGDEILAAWKAGRTSLRAHHAHTGPGGAAHG